MTASNPYDRPPSDRTSAERAAGDPVAAGPVAAGRIPADGPATAHGATDRAAADIAYAEAWRRARRRVRMQRGWFVHATVYAIVIGTMWLVWVFGLHTPRFPWPLPATLGWGLGLTLHGMIVLTRASGFASDWERRRIDAYLREELELRGHPGR